jgi:hypothetical protein
LAVTSRFCTLAPPSPFQDALTVTTLTSKSPSFKDKRTKASYVPGAPRHSDAP